MQRSSSLRLVLSLLLAFVLLASLSAVPVSADGNDPIGGGSQVTPPDSGLSGNLIPTAPVGEYSLLSATYLYLVVL